jgi:hypothetical protein
MPQGRDGKPRVSIDSGLHWQKGGSALLFVLVEKIKLYKINMLKNVNRQDKVLI